MQEEATTAAGSPDDELGHLQDKARGAIERVRGQLVCFEGFLIAIRVRQERRRAFPARSRGYNRGRARKLWRPARRRRD